MDKGEAVGLGLFGFRCLIRPEGRRRHLQPDKLLRRGGGGGEVDGTEGPPDATQVQASGLCQDSAAGRDELPTRTRHSWRGK